MYKTTDVHDALRKAQLSENNRVAMVNANFKLNPIKKEMAEQICTKNGTTFSEYLRQCVEGLILDYVGPKKFKELTEKES